MRIVTGTFSVGALALVAAVTLSAQALGGSGASKQGQAAAPAAITNEAEASQRRFAKRELIVRYRSGVDSGDRAQIREELDATS